MLNGKDTITRLMAGYIKQTYAANVKVELDLFIIQQRQI